MDYEAEIIRELPWLRKMACLYCRQDADIEDLVSDTVVRLWLARDIFDENHRFRSFAYNVMQHIYINQFNRRKCVQFVEQFPAHEPYTHTSADSLIRSRQVVKVVRESSSRSVCIRPVVMYALGYSYKEIADTLGVPLGTVQRRIHEGRKLLKKELEK